MTKETCVPAGNSFPIRHSQPNRIEKGHLSNSNTGIAPRLLNRRQAASYCGLSIQGFSKWVKSGRLPVQYRYSALGFEAINAALDAAGGIGLIRQEDAFDKWKRERNEKRTSRHSSATKKLANGTRRTYFYAWRGGPLIKAEDGTPLKPEDPRFFVAYTDAHRARKMPAQGTMFNLVALFRSSAEFTSLSDKTRKSYSRYLKMIEEDHGDMPIEVVEHPKARGEFKSWRDKLADKPRTADYA